MAPAVILVRVRRGGTIAGVGGGGCDPEDDAVAVLDLEGEGLAGERCWTATGKSAVERMERIDDGDAWG